MRRMRGMGRMDWLALVGLTGCLALTSRDHPWPCDSNADCPDPGETCEFRESASGRVCTTPNGCGTNADCYGGDVAHSICTSGRCGPPPCTTDGDCAGYRCVGSFCAAACAGNEQCSAGHACSGGACRPAACTSDAQCGGYRCNGTTCATSCYPDNCAANYVCNTTMQCACPGGCGAYACVGSSCATSCNVNAPSGSIQGCAQGGSCDSDGKCHACTGTPAPCAAQGPNVCGAIGCTPPSTGSACTGTSTEPCSFFSDSLNCSSISGCTWN